MGDPKPRLATGQCRPSDEDCGKRLGCLGACRIRRQIAEYVWTPLLPRGRESVNMCLGQEIVCRSSSAFCFDLPPMVTRAMIEPVDGPRRVDVKGRTLPRTI